MVGVYGDLNGMGLLVRTLAEGVGFPFGVAFELKDLCESTGSQEVRVLNLVICDNP